MVLIVFGVGMVALISYVAFLGKHFNYKRAEKMYGYFEFDYRGEHGDSKFYGPMLEIDMVGAMMYREKMGATITFQEFGTEDQILEVIDQREYMRNQQIKKSKYHSQRGDWK